MGEMGIVHEKPTSHPSPTCSTPKTPDANKETRALRDVVRTRWAV